MQLAKQTRLGQIFKTKLSVKRQRKREGQTFSRMGEVLSAMPLVQAFGREKYEEEKFDDVTSQTLQESIRLSRLQAAANRSSEIVTTLSMAATVVTANFTNSISSNRQ